MDSLTKTGQLRQWVPWEYASTNHRMAYLVRRRLVFSSELLFRIVFSLQGLNVPLRKYVSKKKREVNVSHALGPNDYQMCAG